MTNWVNINIQLLMLDGYSNIIMKALQILDVLSSFNTEIIGAPLWPSIEDKLIPLFHHTPTRKSVHWTETEVQNCHLHYPEATSFILQTTHNPFMVTDFATRPATFQPPPPPFILQPQNPFSNFHSNAMGTNQMHLQNPFNYLTNSQSTGQQETTFLVPT